MYKFLATEKVTAAIATDFRKHESFGLKAYKAVFRGDLDHEATFLNTAHQLHFWFIYITLRSHSLTLPTPNHPQPLKVDHFISATYLHQQVVQRRPGTYRRLFTQEHLHKGKRKQCKQVANSIFDGCSQGFFRHSRSQFHVYMKASRF